MAQTSTPEGSLDWVISWRSISICLYMFMSWQLASWLYEFLASRFLTPQVPLITGWPTRLSPRPAALLLCVQHSVWTSPTLNCRRPLDFCIEGAQVERFAYVRLMIDHLFEHSKNDSCIVGRAAVSQTGWLKKQTGRWGFPSERRRLPLMSAFPDKNPPEGSDWCMGAGHRVARR